MLARFREYSVRFGIQCRPTCRTFCPSRCRLVLLCLFDGGAPEGFRRSIDNLPLLVHPNSFRVSGAGAFCPSVSQISFRDGSALFWPAACNTCKFWPFVNILPYTCGVCKGSGTISMILSETACFELRKTSSCSVLPSKRYRMVILRFPRKAFGFQLIFTQV